MLSAFLSLFGFGQRHSHAASEKYVEASKLNAQFEQNLSHAMSLLKAEQVRLRHKVVAICENEDEQNLLLGQIETLIEHLILESEVGLATSENTQKTISNSSRFASLRKWDEGLSLLYRHVAASRNHLDHTKRTLDQIHLVLDNAESDTSKLPTLSASIDVFDPETQ